VAHSKVRERVASLSGGIKAAAALVAAVATLGGATSWVLTRAGEQQQRGPSAESERLQQLRAGVTFARFERLLGQQPDVRASIGGTDAAALRRLHASRFVFVRKYDYVQAVVGSEGTVLGFSIVARTQSLHPHFRWFGKPIVLGETRLSAIQAERIGGFCGASRAQYFVAGGGTNSANAQEVAIGVVSMGSDSAPLDKGLCSHVEKLFACHVDNDAYLNALLTFRGNECFLGSAAGKQADDMVMNTYAESAPTIPMSSDLLAPAEPEVAAATGSAP
jgi:hypothetical protein